MLCNSAPQSADIRKFETVSTRSFAIEKVIGEAVNFHNSIGSKRKEERIRFLRNYWTKRATEILNVVLHTSPKAKYSCAICDTHIKGMKPAELTAKLFN